MSGPCDCGGGTDPRALVREGTDRTQRPPAVLDPAAVPIDERRAEHAMVFAAAFASHLIYFTADDQPGGDWREFFESSHAAMVAATAIGDVDEYRTALSERFRLLENPDQSPSATDDARMGTALRDVFDAIATLVRQLDFLHERLPRDHGLRLVITNLIRSQLGAMLQRLVGCYRAGAALRLIDPAQPPPADIVVLGRPAASFSGLLADAARSVEWPAAVGLDTWAQFIDVDPVKYEGLYGSAGSASARINHLAAHNLFRAAADAFLAALARVVDAAATSIGASLSDGSTEPHYALFIAFLRLLEHSRDAVNAFSGKHLDFYYREVLQLSEHAAEPSQAHVIVQLAKHVSQHAIAQRTLVKAGKDERGTDAHFRVDRELVANEATLDQFARLFRDPAPKPAASSRSRLYADVVPAGAASWHPFAEKQYLDGVVTKVDMHPARVGFAIASHYLWMAEGTRVATVRLATAPGSPPFPPSLRLTCLLTTEKELLEVEGVYGTTGGSATITITLTGDHPPITPYDPAVHGYEFGTSLPVLIVLLQHVTTAAWDYAALEGVSISAVTVDLAVKGVRTLELSNDHGPVDAAKPFLVYGSAPRAGSSLVIGSKEVFQKATTELRVVANFPVAPAAHLPSGASAPTVSLEQLSEGRWDIVPEATIPAIGMGSVVYKVDPSDTVVDVPDLTSNDPYTTASRSGFIRLRLSAGFGTETYPLALAKWAITRVPAEPPAPPVLPLADSLAVEYDAETTLTLDAPSEGGGRFFHVTPFGHSEQTIAKDAAIPLVPQFRTGHRPSEGELYLGIKALHPPQDLSILFQVIDGTADPRMEKPEGHVTWAYLRGVEWAPLDAKAVADATDGLLASGIVRISVPGDATTEHTLLPAGLHWLRLSVSAGTDAVCRLAAVRAQAMRATSVGDAEARGIGILPAGTLTKLDRPDVAVKAIAQPYPAFGGRSRETPEAFRTRVSERLRHKDRAIALWDFEHLILERFPSIFQARCLNHTEYKPSTSDSGIYRELAAGHVTIVTIPDLAVPDHRDPLRPFTSLGVLKEVESFVRERVNCFTELHVRNPQFEEVRVDLQARLREGSDESFHLELLARDITEFLSPWAFRRGARPSFNGRVRKSVVIDFIEERPYVDYVTDVHLFHLLPGQQGDGPDLDDVSGSRAISILVSASARSHKILPIHEHSTATATADCGCREAVKA